MKVLILSGGDLPRRAQALVKDFAPDHIIAADAGIRHAMTLQTVPDQALGDFDSCGEEALTFVKTHKIPVRTFPPEKDYTDTELALHTAMDVAGEGGEILILGALGGRVDHSLANIFLMKQAADQGIRCQIADDQSRVFMLKGPCDLTLDRDPDEHLSHGEKSANNISLIPVFGEARGVSLEGFHYPLADADMDPGATLGISNYLEKEEGKVTLREGYLLLILARDKN